MFNEPATKYYSIEEMQRAREQCQTLHKTAAFLGLSVPTVRKYTHTPGMAAQDTRMRRLTDAEKQLIIDDYNKGFSYSKIALDVGCTERTVRDRVKKWLADGAERSGNLETDDTATNEHQESVNRTADTEPTSVFTETETEKIIKMKGAMFNYRVCVDSIGGFSVGIEYEDFRKTIDAKSINQLIKELQEIQRRYIEGQ